MKNVDRQKSYKEEKEEVGYVWVEIEIYALRKEGK